MLSVEQHSRTTHAGLPYPSFFSERDRGSFRVYPITISLPPDYMVMEFVPQDDTAKQTVERLQSSGPPTVTVNSSRHWSLDPAPD